MRVGDTLAVAGAVAVVLSAFALGTPSRGQHAVNRPRERDSAPPARAACRKFAEARLHDPSRAEWIEQWNWTTSAGEGDAWSVHMRFRAPNRMGGQQLNTYLCTVRMTGPGRWQLQQLVSTSP